MTKTIYIMASLEDGIVLADVIRVLEFFKYLPYRVVTHKKLNIIFKQFNNKDIIDLKNFDIEKNKKNLINLILYKEINDCYWDINKYSNGKFDKKKSYHIYKTLSIKNKYPYKLEKIKKNKKLKVGFNYLVPEQWKIKSYPDKKWYSLKEKIEKLDKTKFVVEYQPKLKIIPYIKWIKSCDIIISVVGFGIHLASYFNKKIIMLSGPTDHYDYRKKNKIKKIYPAKMCFVHKKKLYLQNKRCNCMKNISPETIYTAFRKMI